MATLEDLPPDQRAVLQMVLQRGRTYDEIADLLSIDRSAVRQRALDGCDALTPDGVEPGPEQPLVTDYLLSQLPQQVAEQVYIYLEGAEDEREWARAIAGRLDQLAATPLPQIPVAAPLRSDGQVIAEPPETSLYEEPAPLPPPSLSGTPARTAPRERSRVEPPAVPRRERSRAAPAAPPRRRPTVLVGGLGLIVAVVIVGAVILTNGGGSKPKPRRTYTYTPTTRTRSTPTETGTTGTSTTSTQLLSAVNLTSPVGATQTLGVAQVVRVDGKLGIVIDAQGVPANSAHNAYGLWLYNSASSHKFVGFDPSLVGKNGKLAIEGRLPAGASDYRQLLITLETQQHPKTPGEVVLSGRFREK